MACQETKPITSSGYLALVSMYHTSRFVTLHWDPWCYLGIHVSPPWTTHGSLWCIWGDDYRLLEWLHVIMLTTRWCGIDHNDFLEEHPQWVGHTCHLHWILPWIFNTCRGDATHLELVISFLVHLLSLGSLLEGDLSVWTIFDLSFTHFLDIGIIYEREHSF
jgi:hypothetical protein